MEESEETSTAVMDDSGAEDTGKTDDQGRKLYKAKCSDCGQETEVPFEPTPGKPVRCRDCFMKNRPRRNSFGGGRGGGFNRRPREEHAAVCSKCGKNTTVPFKPTGSKPILCRDCYKQEKGF